MSASRALMQIRALNTSVATGLVTGMSPRTTPMGSAISVSSLPFAAADDTHARLPDQRLRHIQAREPVRLRLVGRAADACLGDGRRGKLIRMARDLRGERRDKAIYFALMPAGDALLGRDRPCDKRIRKRIRLTGDEGLRTVPGQDAGLLRGHAGQPARHHDPCRWITAAQLTQRTGGQARPEFACGCAPVKAMQESRPVAGGCRRAASACPAANGVARR